MPMVSSPMPLAHTAAAPPPDVRNAPLVDLTQGGDPKSLVETAVEVYEQQLKWAVTDGAVDMALSSAFNVALGREVFDYGRRGADVGARDTILMAPFAAVLVGLGFAVEKMVGWVRALLGLPSSAVKLQVKAIHQAIQTASEKCVPHLRLLVSREAGCRIEKRLYGMAVTARACSTQGKLILEVADD
jgi:hypothetical protein